MEITYDIKAGDIVKLNDAIIKLKSWPKPELINFKQDFEVIKEHHFKHHDRPSILHHIALLQGVETLEQTTCGCGYLLKDGQPLKWSMEHRDGKVITG